MKKAEQCPETHTAK